MSAHPNKSKGAWINYGCSICKIEDIFTETFSEKVSKIVSKSCEHFDFKFIYNPEKGNLKYMISFICKNCGKDNIEDLYKLSSDGTSNLHYQCIKCNNGDMNFQMILNEEALKEQNKNIQNNMRNNNINNNHMNNNINNDINSFNFNQMQNFNQSMNNIGVIGGNMNQNNVMQFNNFNNNMMNHFNMNQNFPNNNFPMINSFNNMNINNGFNNVNFMNFMMGKMNINNNIINKNNNNNINKNQNLNMQNQDLNIQNQNLNKKNHNPIKNDNNSIKLIFKETTGLEYYVYVSSLDLVFSDVAHKLFEENKTLDINKIRGFLFNGGPVSEHKTLKGNDINDGAIITIYTF